MTKLIRFQILTILVAGLLSSCGISLENTGLQFISRYITLPSKAQNMHTYYQSIGRYGAAYAYFELEPQQTDDFLRSTCFLGLDDFNNEYAYSRIRSQPQQGLPSWWNVSDVVFVREGGCDSNGLSWSIGIAEADSVYKIYLVLVIQ